MNSVVLELTLYEQLAGYEIEYMRMPRCERMAHEQAFVGQSDRQ